MNSAVAPILVFPGLGISGDCPAGGGAGDQPTRGILLSGSGFLGGATGFFNFPGWLLIYFGWVSAGTTLLVCTLVGLVLGE